MAKQLSASTDLRIHTSMARLTGLAAQGRQLTWRPPLGRCSLLSGLNVASQRGRGLDFIELRHYHPGDDVRCIDWKVTQRTGQPYLRVYSEEKDKTIQLIVDQTSSLFFASNGSMKSVIAAELAAIIAGRVNYDGDRFCGNVIHDSGITALVSGRGESAMLTVLQQVVSQNRQLPQTSMQANGLKQVLNDLCQRGIKDQQLFILSDFSDFDAQCVPLITQLAAHNDLFAFRVSDPLEMVLPKRNILMGNEEYQLNIAQNNEQLRAKYHDYIAQHRSVLDACFKATGQPVFDFTTHLDTWAQINSLSHLSSSSESGERAS
ncbi:DUF58 domain-containing protein [Vibrio sp. ZSDE26]|uniref:DUF58 domain-containing protein n=1 Tax=Vibrio amylolyticus TaxID=2847292 RepID=A0A9X1XKY0_9VIBR|nr:DUF58 domain-containing protein [Vibrio amylolyticus]MCK6262780.1 DUF58 domain-containing protein [Vibrio amylolyticus]